MITYKDTAKAVNAATTLIKYCNKYKHCNNCVFYKSDLDSTILGCCAVNFPCKYREVDKEVNK